MKKLEDYRTRNERLDLLVITGELENGTFEYKTNVTKHIYENTHKLFEELITEYVMRKFPTAVNWTFNINEYKK